MEPITIQRVLIEMNRRMDFHIDDWHYMVTADGEEFTAFVVYPFGDSEVVAESTVYEYLAYGIANHVNSRRLVAEKRESV